MTRQTWGSKLEYSLTILGYGMGLMWKWPYLCMRNGGGAFIIPFIIFTLIGAIPCAYMEFAIGQFSQSGAVEVWNLCPLFKGLGLGAVIIGLYFTTYYIVFLAWFMYYLYHSFSTVLPWTTCTNEWNTPTCISYDGNFSAYGNGTNTSVQENMSTKALTAAEEFWRYKVLNITDDLTEVGNVQGHTVACLAIMYTLIFLCIFKGIRVSGKVVYVTVILPYILITVLLIRGSLLPGSAEGIWYYINPDFEKLLDPKIWVEAMAYALFSPGIAMGCLITLSSHNKFNNNCLKDALSIILVDALSSIYTGFAFFTILGHVAHIRGVTVNAFQSSGINLGFIVYPQAVATLPLPQLWSVLLFILFLTLGIDSAMPGFEIAVTPILEQFPHLSRHRWLVTILVIVPSFLVGIVYSCQGGMYILTLVEWYATFPSLLVFTLMECIVLNWIYGTDRLSKDITMMTGNPMPRVARICLKFICPVIMTTVFGYALYSYRPPRYDSYTYPSWATLIGWLIAFSSILPIPAIFVATVLASPGKTFKQKLKFASRSNEKWGPKCRQTDENNYAKQTVEESILT